MFEEDWKVDQTCSIIFNLITLVHDVLITVCFTPLVLLPPSLSFYPPSFQLISKWLFIPVATISAKKYNKASLVCRDWHLIKLWIVRFLAEGWCDSKVRRQYKHPEEIIIASTLDPRVDHCK